MREHVAPLVRLPLPPKKGDVGIFEPGEARRTRAVDVLEVVDGYNAILRVWYTPAPGEEETFADLWLTGLKTNGWTAGTPAKLAQVFHVTGNKVFGTTCGQRSLPLLEPLDIERYR
jgi:hypothetical protein